MRINFFEEYPIEENMAKLDMINWPSTILLAVPSLKEFENIRAKYSVKYSHITFGWWPTIPGSYWVSAIANPSDLERLFSELTSKIHEKELPVLIDLELPIKKHLYFKNILRIWSNKKRISKFFIEAPNFNLKLYTAEYPASNKLLYQFWKLLSISPSLKFEHTKLPMVYSSMGLKYFGNKIWKSVKNFEKRFARANYKRVGFGLGTIAVGVLGNEPILKPQDLKVDMAWAKECDVDEIFIFRLGGINKDYKLILEDFIDNPGKVSFVNEKGIREKIENLFQIEKGKLQKLFPDFNIEHIGGTSVPNSLTKGDLDINIRVPKENFANVVDSLKKIYQINQPNNWTKKFASFKDYSRDLGIQLTVVDSADDVFVKQRDFLKSHPEKVLELNKLKLSFNAKSMDDYRKAKGEFFENLKL